MNDVQLRQTEPFGSKTRAKKYIDRELRTAISDCATVLVEQHAAALAADPPIFKLGTPVSEALGWFFPLGETGDRIYMQVLTAAHNEAERLFSQHQLATRPDAGAWQRWLSKRAAFWAVQCARVALVHVVQHMERLLTERYGVPFEHSYAHNAVAFYLPDTPNLGEGWEVVHDGVAKGCRPEDPGYLRVVYAYHPERGLLLRLHHIRIHLPWGRQAVKWIIARAFTGVWRSDIYTTAAAQ